MEPAQLYRQAIEGGITPEQIGEFLIASMELDTIPENLRPLLKPHVDETVFAGWRAPFLQTDPADLQSGIEQELSTIEAPFLVVFSRQPWPEHDLWLHTLVPQARIDVYDTPGHFPHLAHPDPFTTALRTLRRGPTPTAPRKPEHE